MIDGARHATVIMVEGKDRYAPEMRPTGATLRRVPDGGPAVSRARCSGFSAPGFAPVDSRSVAGAITSSGSVLPRALGSVAGSTSGLQATRTPPGGSAARVATGGGRCLPRRSPHQVSSRSGRREQVDGDGAHLLQGGGHLYGVHRRGRHERGVQARAAIRKTEQPSWINVGLICLPRVRLNVLAVLLRAQPAATSDQTTLSGSLPRE